MKKFHLFSPAVLLLLCARLFAQGESAVPFLMIHPSPNLNAMAGAYTALPSNDAFGQFFNPAQLGNFGRENNLSIQIYPQKVNWLPAFDFSDLTFNSRVLAVGYNISKFIPKISASLGIGYIETDLNLGKNVWTDEYGNYVGTFESKEDYSAVSIGMGLEYIVRFNIGYTKKEFNSKLRNYTRSSSGDDYGWQLTVPVLTLAEMFWERPLILTGKSIPHFDLSIGYSKSNVGGRTEYIEKDFLEPLPRQVKIGYAFSLGLKQDYKNFIINTVNFSWSSEARDMLIHVNDYGGKKYIDSPGAINFLDNVLLGKSNNQVTIYQGWKINFLDFFQYSQGRFKGPGYPNYHRTHGFVFSSRGILNFFSANSNIQILKYFANHFELNYIGMRYTADGPLNNTEFEGISLTIFGY